MKTLLTAISAALVSITPVGAQEEHHHPAPEHLGSVSFKVSCAPAVTMAFDRAVALLHSFAYEEADRGFADIVIRDPSCAMAHWGRAMPRYHQLWDAPAGASLSAGIAEVRQAQAMGTGTPRERALISALAAYYANANQEAAASRAMRYSD